MPGNAQLRVLNPFVGERLRDVMSRFMLPAQGADTCGAAGGVSSFGYSGTIAHTVLRRNASGQLLLPERAPLFFRCRSIPWTTCQETMQSPALGVLRDRTEASSLWHRTLSPANIALLRGHHIGTVPVVPGPLYIHVARAVMNITGHRGPITIDVEFMCLCVCV